MSDDDKTVFVSRTPSPPENQRPASGFVETAADTGSLSYFGRHSYENRLLYEAQKTIAVIQSIRMMAHFNDVKGFHRKLIEEIRQLDETYRSSGQSEEVALITRYMLCAALDEAAVNTPWGDEAGWSGHSLLQVFHKESFGGEKFFAIVEKLLRKPAEYIDLIELAYILISLGFEGKYKAARNGGAELDQIKTNLFKTIEHYRNIDSADLSDLPARSEERNRQIMHLVPAWIIVAFFLTTLLLLYAWFQYSLNKQAEETSSYIDLITNEVKSAPGK
ncbi:type IVB secretion system protein IcmH/DotU [Marinobacter sp. chi1]|uniref:Type IVB secretion system protein IcmH/DotU n=1 Tax=Marinobacter suaedae TaxID=3057675 RepID=A0ABT8VW52_9GAMM|nr:type IVB secretion system protein IcmH/DotU [Marinobacter sp. chi1]MDO3720173.1 type IVB secretion system protein IcmH/DotU [Marinobacter sp. chi1]